MSPKTQLIGLFSLQAMVQISAIKWLDPFNLMFTLCVGAGSFNYMRQYDEFIERMNQSLEVGNEQGLPIAEEFVVPFFRGHGLVSCGYYQEGYEELKKGSDAWFTLGGRGLLPALWTALAEAAGHIGQVSDGLEQIDKAIALIEEIGEP